MNNQIGKVLSFGELLLRICPDAEGQWLEENRLSFYIGGAEANVASALALWDVPSAYLTAVPDNSMAQQVVEYLEQLRIDTSAIVKQGDRLGIYYLTKGKDLKNAGVIYDRANSSYSQLKVNTIDWETVFKGVSWFHFSAICPAINQDIADVCEEALKVASAKGITVSLDLNYRAKLWKYGKDPVEIMPALAKYSTLIMGNIWAANKMLGTGLDENLIGDDLKESYLKQARLTSEELMQKFPACTTVANTFRFDHGKGIRYYTTLFDGKDLVVSHEYVSEKILDKVGSGDCFMGGLIYGFYNRLPASETLEFATAAAYDKLYIPSDATKSTVADIRKRMTESQPLNQN